MDSEDETHITPEEIAELDRRWANYKANPSSAISFEALKAKLASKYGGLPPKEAAELDRRRENYLNNPSSAISKEDFDAKIRKIYRKG